MTPGTSVPLPAAPKPAPPKTLRTVMIIDYQNVHLVGRARFRSGGEPTHLSLIHPLLYARRVVEKRNSRQAPGCSKASLEKVLVFRGQPDATLDPVGYGANMAQTHAWEEGNSHIIEVTNRPLKYDYERDSEGRKLKDINGNYIQKPGTKPMEKGVDVLCALAAYRSAQRADIDLVIVASIDSDLIPALHAIQDSRGAKVETVCWGDKRYGPYGELSTEAGHPSIWITRLDREDFEATVDRTTYLF